MHLTSRILITCPPRKEGTNIPKPGQSPNVSNPEVSAMQGIMDANSVGSGSRQTPATTQTASMNPNRLVPTPQAAGPHGRAEVEVNGVMPDQGRANDTQATGYNFKWRKQRFVSNP